MLHLLDTSALKWAYIPSKFHRRCRYLCSRFKGEIFIAEISALELVNALGSEYRGRRISAIQYERADRRFFHDIADGLIEVKSLSASEFIACRNLLALVGFQRRRNLTSQDGMVAYTARQLAIERKTTVKLLTSDKNLASVVNEIDIFKSLVVAEYLDRN